MDDRPLVTGEIIVLDYSTLQETIYQHCKMIYRGGRPPTIINCEISECEFILENEALNTQIFLSILVEGGAGDMVAGMLGLQGEGSKK
jgi:hypothetical protein